jgi:hypothetical protein
MGFVDDFNSHLADLLATLGQEVIWSSQGGVATPITGIYEWPYFEVEGDGTVGVVSSQPKLTCASADIPGMATGDTITVQEKTYRVVVIQPDGTGVTDLILEAL